jgi:molybdopterin-guanine dinucleotide biosynthesis protein A
METSSSAVVMGILIGGQAKRMGGVQKALLRPPYAVGGDTLVDRLVALGRAAGLEAVLLGRADLGVAAADVPQLADPEPGAGPLGGLCSLFAYAAGRRVIVLGCDMPYVSAALLQRLLREAPEAMLLAPRDHDTGKWQPLFARYDSALLQPLLERAWARGERSFQQLFAHTTVGELVLSASEQAQLRDWDTPEDIARS